MISYGNQRTTRRVESKHDHRADCARGLAGALCMLLVSLWAVPAAGQLLAGLDEPLADDTGAVERSIDGQVVRPVVPIGGGSPDPVTRGAMSGFPDNPSTSPTATTVDPRLSPGMVGLSPWLFRGRYAAPSAAGYPADPFARDPIIADPFAAAYPGHLRLRNTIDFLTLGLLRPPQGSHQNLGQPLVRESWRYRPLSAGWFMGSLNGDVIQPGWLGMKDGFLGGYRLGWDFDHYWGYETRFAFASVELSDSRRAIQEQEAADALVGIDPDSAWGRRFDDRRDADVRLWDVDLLYYPWGDTAWRPYFLIGLGSGRMDTMDRLSRRRIKRVLGMPLAIGLKYRATDWAALRFEFADNILFGSTGGGSTLHNLSLTGGIEMRFGGTRKAYWPYNPGRHYW